MNGNDEAPSNTSYDQLRTWPAKEFKLINIMYNKATGYYA